MLGSSELKHIDRKLFLEAYRASFPGKMVPQQIRGLQQLLDFLEADSEVEDIRWAAYMLATVKHECADTWQPIVERGHRSYFDKYEPSTSLGKRLGNKAEGDGYKTRGRGYVMITGLDNYSRMNRLLGLTGTEDDILVDPDRALKPEIAYRIMSLGMRKGLFTGRKLADYIAGEQRDYINARRIVNSLDRAHLIASYASNIELALREALI